MSSVNPFFRDRESSMESDFQQEQHLVDGLATQVDNETVQRIINSQKESLRRFEKTNEMLTNCTALSEKRLEKAKRDAAQHRETILQMKSDLELIFRKIRYFKSTLATKYSQIYQQVSLEFAEKANGEEDE